MRRAAADLFNVAEAINERGHITRAHLRVSSAEASFAVAAHRIYVATVTLNEDCMLFAATNVTDDDIEAADLG